MRLATNIQMATTDSPIALAVAGPCHWMRPLRTIYADMKHIAPHSLKTTVFSMAVKDAALTLEYRASLLLMSTPERAAIVLTVLVTNISLFFEEEYFRLFENIFLEIYKKA